MNLLALQRNLRDHLIQGSADIGREISGDSSARLAVYHYAYRAPTYGLLARYVRARVGPGSAMPASKPRGKSTSSCIRPTAGRSLIMAMASIARSRTSTPTIPRLPSWHGSIGRYAGLSMARTRIPSKSVDLSRVDWNTAILYLVPTLRISPISTNCAAIWTALSDGRSPPSVQRLALPWGFASGGLDYPAFSQHRCSRAACTPYGNRRARPSLPSVRPSNPPGPRRQRR